jgi:CRISPR/Cas system-associated exonuclease Cas4 (RecB family)
MNFSASDINTYEFCPRQWHYEHVINREEADRIAIQVKAENTDVGVYVHKSIDKYYQLISERVIDENVIRQTVEEAFSSDTRYDNMRTKKIIDNFVKFELERVKAKDFVPQFTEKRLETDIQGLHVVGVIDAMFKNGTCIDWKTGNNVEMENFTRQGNIYRILLQNNGIYVNKILFVMLLTGQKIEIPFSTDAWIVAEFGKIDANNVTPNRGSWCKFCPFELNCETEGEEIWNLL